LFRISIDNDDIELSKWIYENYNISKKDINYVNKQISMYYDWNNYKWIKNIDVENCFQIACLNNNLKNIDFLKPFISKKDIYCEITKSIINNNYETFEKLIEISIFSQKDGQ
jgi:enoyl-[acyl-carrier-protein] reductase (NADH)